MKAKIIKIIQLEINEQEARWLQYAMQNPLHNKTPDLEDNYDKTIREELFNIIKDKLMEK